jgi:hypothetical protein
VHLICRIVACAFELTHSIIDAVRSAQKDVSMLKNMMLTRFDSMDRNFAQLAETVLEVNNVTANLARALTVTCAARRGLAQQKVQPKSE